ncbi:MAG: DNA-3-methyladenine glycosylase [Bacteroidales bacterium]|nr:DNA-3-methyladenine glycosylase [Bacteroidales bacterium]
MFANRLGRDFYTRDVLNIAGEILGKPIVVYQNDKQHSDVITEVEIYRGIEDKGCHVSRGRTKRNEIMFDQGGLLYVYLIYGMHWMLNIVTGNIEEPQALLIRGLENINGPGRLTKALGIDRSFHGEDLVTSSRIWIGDVSVNHREIIRKSRIGIDYADEYWKNMPWRYVLKNWEAE